MKYLKALCLTVCLILPIQATGSNLTTLFNNKEVLCLAKNIYHESRGEKAKGQEAVALVTLNRVKDKRWPDTVCKVVYQYRQFSWTLSPKKVKNKEAWEKSLDLAYRVLNGNLTLVNFNAVYFHTHQVRPKWSYSVKKVASIGNHAFYC